MKKNINLLFLTLFMLLSFDVSSQTIKPTDIIISTLLPDNIIGRYNIGLEYFFQNKKNKDLGLLSILLNGGKTSTTIQNQKINGFDLTGEVNLYGELLMSKKWNEYGGLKLNYGNFNNESTNEKKESYFIGISTGIQPIILKRMALKLNSDIGYMKNGLASTSFFSSSNDIFYSGFTINFNVGLGIYF